MHSLDVSAFEVVIIGGGVIGCAIAWRLAEAGEGRNH